MGPDGSLCRITSSAKDLVNNVRIIKVPDSEPSYRLVVVRSNDEHEELSEESDEVISDDELSDVKLPSENIEKEKVIETKIDNFDKSTETVSQEIVKECNHNNMPQSDFKRNNRFSGQRNNFNKIRRKYKNTSGTKRIYNYGNRNFNSAHSGAYNASIQYPCDNISPWINPPVVLCTSSYATFPLAPHPEKSKHIGLLGDCPSYVPPLPQFQPNKQNDNYIHNQNSTFSPLGSSFQSNTESDSFVCDQNSLYSTMASNFSSNNHDGFIHKQNSSYSQMPSNYPSSKQTDNGIHKQNYWNNGYGNYNKNNQKKNAWNKKRRRCSNRRRNKSYEYRN